MTPKVTEQYPELLPEHPSIRGRLDAFRINLRASLDCDIIVLSEIWLIENMKISELGLEVSPK